MSPKRFQTGEGVRLVDNNGFRFYRSEFSIWGEVSQNCTVCNKPIKVKIIGMAN